MGNAWKVTNLGKSGDGEKGVFETPYFTCTRQGNLDSPTNIQCIWSVYFDSN